MYVITTDSINDVERAYIRNTYLPFPHHLVPSTPQPLKNLFGIQIGIEIQGFV